MSIADNNTLDIITSYTYNSQNQVLSQSLPNGIVIENIYDSNGNLISKETSNIKNSSLGNYSTLITFEYDSLGQLIESSDAK
jgi:YD repeat-containing protein